MHGEGTVRRVDTCVVPVFYGDHQRDDSRSYHCILSGQTPQDAVAVSFDTIQTKRTIKCVDFT